MAKKLKSIIVPLEYGYIIINYRFNDKMCLNLGY